MRKKEVQVVRESEVKAVIRDFLRWHGWYVVNIFQTLGCHPGIADLYAIKDGRHVWIEVKRPGGRQSDAQKEFQRQIESHGGMYVLARGIKDLLEKEYGNIGWSTTPD